MNLKLPIKVAKRQVDRLLKYVKDCGYAVEVHESDGLTTYMAPSCPLYGEITPMAESVAGEGHFIYLRLPRGDGTGL